MANSTCPACGAAIKIVSVEGRRIRLDAVPTFNGRFQLDAEDVDRAIPIKTPGRQGHLIHDCPRG
jgi:hypothetical protein